MSLLLLAAAGTHAHWRPCGPLCWLSAVRVWLLRDKLTICASGANACFPVYLRAFNGIIKSIWTWFSPPPFKFLQPNPIFFVLFLKSKVWVMRRNGKVDRSCVLQQVMKGSERMNWGYVFTREAVLSLHDLGDTDLQCWFVAAWWLLPLRCAHKHSSLPPCQPASL